ncbi:hypothetical protein MZO21_06405 [Acinetobacter portensis]|uniref:DUF1634 domain-containing protein n=1 Tax=Acinetobacter portensis TaxID=1839785 RepID=A0ABY4JRW4_9GAMM|nr:hypothetical protein [Acinetobacter portensis]UPO22176.1 hypothetical protein MZO21_06405 [Acinetobacter portensis]
MTYILLFLSVFFISLSALGFFYSSEKARKETLKNNLKLLAIYPKTTKFFSSLFIIFSFSLLSYMYGYSIAFLSIWILCTPVFLFVIFLKNNLNPQPHKHKSKNN